MEKPLKSFKPGILTLVFLSSMASLSFEVLLTRIFSITIWYHFAFMVISIAMLGFAASGIILAIYPGLKKLDHIGWYTLALGAAMPTGFLLANLVAFDPVRLAWERWELVNILLTYLCLALPFFCTGLVIATAFSVENHSLGLGRQRCLFCSGSPPGSHDRDDRRIPGSAAAGSRRISAGVSDSAETGV